MSAAAAFAEKAEALGWQVDRSRRPGWRGVQVTQGQESFTFEWTQNPKTGNYVFSRGEHATCCGGIFREEWTNLTAALRIMADPGTVHADGEGGYYRLPFDPAADAAEVYTALRGRTVTWRNGITGALEAAIVPWNGRHTRLEAAPEPARRVLTFASFEAGSTPVSGYPAGHDTRAGFRSVRLSAIREVGDKCYRPRG